MIESKFGIYFQSADGSTHEKKDFRVNFCYGSILCIFDFNFSPTTAQHMKR